MLATSGAPRHGRPQPKPPSQVASPGECDETRETRKMLGQPALSSEGEAVHGDAMPTRQSSAAADANADIVALVLARLSGDVPSLCAAACVARAWRDAAAKPQLWAHVGPLPLAAARRLTDARLATLVARAAGGLERLRLDGAEQLTEEGLAVALQQPHALTDFCAPTECRTLTAISVARALASRRGQLLRLSVRGLECGPPVPKHDAGQAGLAAWRREVAGVVRALRALLAPGGVLDGDRLCNHEAHGFAVHRHVRPT